MSLDKQSTIAFLGLGAMGSRMATRLLEAGFPVTVYSRTESRTTPLVERGASSAKTPRGAASGAGAVISMVTDDDASRAVWLGDEGALGGIEPDAIAIEASTLTPAWAEELAATVERRGAHFLDAPVVGTRPQAEAGQLIFLVGGAHGALEAARPALEPLAGGVHHVGAPGRGMAIKLAINSYFAIQVTALAEALGLATQNGIELARAAEIFKALPITAPALAGVAGQIEASAFAPLFPIDLVAKDLRYVLEAAASSGSDAPASRAALATYEEARQAGHGDENISAVARLFVRR